MQSSINQTPLPEPSNERHFAHARRAVRRLRRLVMTSLILNALILLFLLSGAIVHHRHMEREYMMGFRGGDRFPDRGPEGDPRFQRFEPGPRGGFDRGSGQWDQGLRDASEMGPRGPRPGMPDMNFGNADPATMSEMALNHLSQKLSLTHEEMARIKPIVDAQVADMPKQMESQRNFMQKQMEDTKSKIRALLTPDQQKQLDAMPLPGQVPPLPD